jgi:PKD repeat protein
MKRILILQFILVMSLLVLTPGLAFSQASGISYSPTRPNVEQRTTFTVIPMWPPVPGGKYTWNFGDGSRQIRTTGTTVRHEFLAAGTYTVRVNWSSYKGAQQEQAQIVVRERRYITYSPADPGVGQMITFHAHYFLEDSLSWDFGDGNFIALPQGGGPNIVTHTYTSGGSYTVSVRDKGGAGIVPITLGINIKQGGSITVSPEADRLRVGQPATFTYLNATSDTVIRWDFGDGTVTTAAPPSITHIYNQYGTYLVQAYDGNGSTVTATLTVTVHPPASISVYPPDPRPGETVTITANYFFSSTLIRWNFSDGSGFINDTSPPQITHTFSTPGSYLIQAYDGGGTTLTASLMLQVLPDRLITFSPQPPLAEVEVLLNAYYFNISQIAWNFGDGNSVEAGTQVRHTYDAPGRYTVTAWDLRDNEPFPVTIQILVYPSRGPRAPFTISYINLRFGDGKSYTTVPQHYDKLIAYADIKYEGTGILNLQFLVDGNPFRILSQTLPLADQTTVDSGELPCLPTLTPGRHEVTLNVLEPTVHFEIPVIRYFVSIDPRDEDRVDLNVSDATGLDRQNLPFSPDSVFAPPGKHFILRGVVINESKKFIPVVLLRIYLGSELVDQKLMMDLEAGEERTFETSIFNAAETEKKIYITLYNISKKPAQLVYIKELNIIDRE